MTFRTFLVGGAVRDELLGRPVKDRDWVVVGATPEDMLAAGFEQVGADFPVFLHPETREEHALARQERKTGPGYKGFETHFDPSVTLEDDLVRRDLTVNAMARDPDTGELIDPHGGLDDLRAGVLRHVSEAFAEDPLRVLRVARFAARFNFRVAPETMELMKQLVDAGELDHLTPERVWTELEKAVMEEQPSKFFWTLDKCGAKDVLFPEVGRTLVLSGWSLSRAALRNADRLTRLVLLFSQMRWEDTNELLTRLKAPTDVQRLTRKFRLVLCALENQVSRPGDLGSWDMTAERMLSLFKSIDAFRQPDDVFAVSGAVGFVSDSKLPQRMDTLLSALREARKVAFATLTEEQQATLKGAAVGEALDTERTKRIKEVM